MSKSIVLNGKAVVIPDDLALKLELLMQVSDKRDNELAQSIADTNDRITNLDLVTGAEGLAQEIKDRKDGDAKLQTQVDTLSGTVADNNTKLTEDINQLELLSGTSMVQGTKGEGTILPGISLAHSAQTVTVRFQIPGDDKFIINSITTDYKNIMSFRDTKDCMIWEKQFSDARGPYPWRNVITVDAGGVDEVFIDGMTTYLQADGKLIIRGYCVSDNVSDWIGNRTNRGFRPQSVMIVISSDYKTIEKIDWTGDMGIMTEVFSIGYGAKVEAQRLDGRISLVGGASQGTYSSTGAWQSLNEKIPYCVRPIRTMEASFSVMDSTNNIYYNFTSDGSLRIRQNANNSGKYFMTAGLQWATNDPYSPTNWNQLPNWGA